MGKEILVEELLRNRTAWQVVDVRSPGEFEAGHIPGAINLPLFTDEERAAVGTMYKQQSPETAMVAGLGFAGKKMPELVSAGIKLAKKTDRRLLVHCWRGGKRSQAVEWLLSFAGVEVSRLQGGYKSYRTALQAFFHKNDFRLNIIGGYTGAGKTEVLHSMEVLGEQIIDLEGLAEHKGSAFGGIGGKEQPTNEQFENRLYEAFLRLNPRRPVWLENESKNIGRIYLPEGLWRRMRNSVLYELEVSRSVRLGRVIQDYTGAVHVEELKLAFARIQKRLGGLEYKQAIQALDAGDLRTAAEIALQYYDKSYSFQLDQWPKENVVFVDACDQVPEAAKKLIYQHYKKQGQRI